MSLPKVQLEKLGDNNYESWASILEVLADNMGAAYTLSSQEPANVTVEKWDKDSGDMRMYITTQIDQQNCGYIQDFCQALFGHQKINQLSVYHWWDVLKKKHLRTDALQQFRPSQGSHPYEVLW